MKQDELERLLSAARDYNDPPETPREAMWAAIQAAGRPERRAEDGASGGTGDALDLDARRAVRERRQRLRRWTPWALGLAAAATLAVGFGLGRAAERAVPGVVDPAASPATATSRSGEASLPVRLAAADHMGDAEALLTLYRTSDRTDDREAAAVWARELLGTTRLLLDTRAGDDPRLAELLRDLELVLVQIASGGTGDGTEQELIEDGIEQRQLLTKLRTAARPLDTAL